MRFIHVIFSACNFPTRIFLLSLSPSSLLTNAFPFFFPFSAITGFFLFSSSPDNLFFYCHPRAVRFLVIPGLDPGIHPTTSTLHVSLWILGASPRMTVPLCPSQKMLEHRGSQGTVQNVRRLPCRSPSGAFIFLVIPGLRPEGPSHNKHPASLSMDCRIKSGNDRRKKARE